MTKRMLTTGEVGRYCGVHFRTVLRWIEAGKLKAHRLPGARGEYRVQLSDFLAFLRQFELPIPEELRHASCRVLVVEDEPHMARAIERILRMAGFETAIAADGLKAGVLLQSFAPAVMTLDLRMPGTGGLEVLRFMRETPALCDVKVLVVSALHGEELRRARAEGAHDVLEKPFKSEVLVEKVAVLAGVDVRTGVREDQ